MDRRKFLVVGGQGSLLVLAGSAMMGCPTNWFSELEASVPEAIQFTTDIIGEINPVAGSALAVITAALPGLWSAVDGAIGEYQSTTPPPVGALAKVTTGLTDVSDNLAAFIAALPTGVTISKIELDGIMLGLKLTISTLNYLAEKNNGTASASSKTAALGTQPATSHTDYVAKINALKIPLKSGAVVHLGKK